MQYGMSIMSPPQINNNL
uniref:Uncharacterized protein n=1 Tax=Anguilla anguilla TaxID=7936 RepID=A0A0E9T5U7_ANGAN